MRFTWLDFNWLCVKEQQSNVLGPTTTAGADILLREGQLKGIGNSFFNEENPRTMSSWRPRKTTILFAGGIMVPVGVTQKDGDRNGGVTLLRRHLQLL